MFYWSAELSPRKMRQFTLILVHSQINLGCLLFFSIFLVLVSLSQCKTMKISSYMTKKYAKKEHGSFGVFFYFGCPEQ